MFGWKLLICVSAWFVVARCDAGVLTEQGSDGIDPIAHHEGEDKDQSKRTIFESNFGWAKHVRLNGKQKLVLGYSPVDLKYVPVVKPLVLRRPGNGWRFKPKFQRRPKPVYQVPVKIDNGGWKPLLPAHVPVPPNLVAKPWQGQGWSQSVPGVQQPHITRLRPSRPFRPSPVDHVHHDIHQEHVHHDIHQDHIHQAHDIHHNLQHPVATHDPHQLILGDVHHHAVAHEDVHNPADHHLHVAPTPVVFHYDHPSLHVDKPVLPVLPLGATFPLPVLQQQPHHHHLIPQPDAHYVPQYHGIYQIQATPQVTQLHPVPQVPHLDIPIPRVPHIDVPQVHLDVPVSNVHQATHFHQVPYLHQVPSVQDPYLHQFSNAHATSLHNPHLHQIPNIQVTASQHPHLHLPDPQLHHHVQTNLIPHAYPSVHPSQIPNFNQLPPTVPVQIPNINQLPPLETPNYQISHQVPQQGYLPSLGSLQHGYHSSQIQDTTPQGYHSSQIQQGYHSSQTQDAIQQGYHSPQIQDSIQPTYHSPQLQETAQQGYHSPQMQDTVQQEYHSSQIQEAAHLQQGQTGNQITIEYHGRGSHAIPLNHLFQSNQQHAETQNSENDISGYQQQQQQHQQEDFEQTNQFPTGNGLHPGYTDLQIPLHLPQHPNLVSTEPQAFPNGMVQPSFGLEPPFKK